MKAFLFAGQGSQYVGMGKDLYEAFAASRSVFDRADKALGFSISKLCFEGPQEELRKTDNCQPAILTMSIAALEAFNSIVADPLSASYAAGLSLGEYSALVAAGALSFEDAVILVRKRGQLMEEAAAAQPGKMLSLIGLDLAVVREICAATDIEIANINCPGQTVVSGSPQNIETAAQLANEKYKAKMAVVLEVSGAFHSSFMKPAALKLATEIEKVRISSPKVPVISNVTAQPFVSGAEIKENLIKQVYSSVLWEDSMKFILSKGIKDFIEFGPGKVLKGLMRRIEPGALVQSVEKKEDIG